MSRVVWFAAGAVTSAYAIVKARRAAEALTPEGLRDRVAGLQRGAELFRDELLTEMAARETDLRDRLGLDRPEAAALGAPVTAPLQLTRKGNT